MNEVVVLGSSPTGLYAVRELARAGFQVACADIVRGCAMASRYVPGPRCHVGSLEAVRDWLEARADAAGAPLVLVPTSDVFIEFVMRHAVASPRFRVFDAYRGIAGTLLDKARFHDLCQAHGMATPGIWHAADAAALASLAGEVPFPCILKPVLIHRAKAFLGGRKVLLARSRSEYDAHVAAIPGECGAWLVQEIIPGAESAITLFAGHVDRAGGVRQAMTARKLRQYPAGFGSASLATSEPCEETAALSADFLQRIGFSGVCGAEFKRDPRDGRLKIIEINPRPTLWFQLTHDAGLRIVEDAVRALLELPAVPATSQRTDVRWRYALKDAASARHYRRHGGDFIFPAPDVASAARAVVSSWPVYAASDPLPALAEPLGYLGKLRGRRA